MNLLWNCEEIVWVHVSGPLTESHTLIDRNVVAISPAQDRRDGAALFLGNERLLPSLHTTGLLLMLHEYPQPIHRILSRYIENIELS